MAAGLPGGLRLPGRRAGASSFPAGLRSGDGRGQHARAPSPPSPLPERGAGAGQRPSRLSAHPGGPGPVWLRLPAGSAPHGPARPAAPAKRNVFSLRAGGCGTASGLTRGGGGWWCVCDGSASGGFARLRTAVRCGHCRCLWPRRVLRHGPGARPCWRVSALLLTGVGSWGLGVPRWGRGAGLGGLLPVREPL